jgi:sugar lactone lactonase YvrE
MVTRFSSFILGVCTILVCTITGGARADAAGFNASMSTFAGSGAIGYRDGDALTSTFTVPVGVALGPNGAVYVADAGSQRIRIISNGRVRTLAGSGSFFDRGSWVRGAYRDGAGAQAAFNFPAGLAVDSKGRVYVADADNHCIRAIEPDGTVSTYAGSPMQSTEINGPRASAGFHRPMGVALNSSGDVFVADEGVGLRKIAADGTVTTYYKDPGVTGVSVSPDGRTVIGTNLTGSMSVVLDGSNHELASADPLIAEPGAHLGDLADVGHPFAATMIDTYRAIYTDAKTGSIRYIDLYLGANKFIAGDRGAGADNDEAGYRDGPLETARVFDPLGVAVTPNGTLYVADSGNRRIRRVATLNFRNATIVAINALPPQLSEDASKHVIVTGNSYVWANCVWDDSWEGMLEARLRGAGHSVTIYPVFLGAPADTVMFDYIKGTLADLPGVDRVYFLANHGNVDSSGAGWRAAYVAGLQSVRDALQKNHVKFSVIVQPTAYDFDWAALPVIRYLREDANLYLPKATAMSPVYADLLAATKESGVPYLDLSPYFLADFRSTTPHPQYGTSEGHQTNYGRSAMAEAMFKAMTATPAPAPK